MGFPPQGKDNIKIVDSSISVPIDIQRRYKFHTTLWGATVTSNGSTSAYEIEA